MRVMLFAIVACCLIPGVIAHADETFSSIDLDRNGRIDEQEAQAAGRAVFQRLDANRDGNLDAPEIDGRLGLAVLKAADPGADRALNAEDMQPSSQLDLRRRTPMLMEKSTRTTRH